MYICKHFKIKELVPLSIIIQYGENGAWSLLTDDIKITADAIRKYFGKAMTVNGKGQQFRGLRTPESRDYNPNSQHAIGKGNAIDFNTAGLTPAFIRKTILDNQHEKAFQLIGGIEDFNGMTWIHVDCRKRILGKIQVFGR